MNESHDDNTDIHHVLTKGTKVSHYTIIEKIGAGGMGEVYLAEDERLHRKVAMKFLPSHMLSNQDIRTRFVREAQTLAKLNHPNIVSIHDVSEFNGRPYYVMELVEGETLHYFAHEKPLPIETIIEYAIQICQGLGEAHRAGIIHRDIKAANISVGNEGRIRLLDFGLAASSDDDKITKTGSTLGTVAYMSPEQVSGREIDHRSDLFSLGVVLYELLAGQTPFRRDNEGATLKAIMEENPEPLARYKTDVPDNLNDIIAKLLEKDKEIRFQTAEGVIADLKRLMYDSQSSSYSRSTYSKPKSNKTGLIAAVAIFMVIIIASVYYFISKETTTQTADLPEVPMIAVLPFENLGNPSDQYFADGITQEITSRLVGIDGLGVISSNSAMKYRSTDKTHKEIGEELGVQYILEGTVQWSKVDDQAEVRITPQLIFAATDRNLWSDIYQRALMEVFAVQADIAEKIVEQLGLTLVESDREQLYSIPTLNSEAYQLYLKVLNSKRNFEWWQQHPEDWKKDIDSIVKLDPEFALAHVLRSEIYADLAFQAPESEFAKISLESAQKSLELQPGLPQGHQALGYYYNQVETDYDRALEEFSMAHSELHNNAELLDAIAYVQMRQGNYTDAIDNTIKAVELDPLNTIYHSTLGDRLTFQRRFEESIQSIDRAISLDPKKAYNYNVKMFTVLAQSGDIKKVTPIFEQALENVDTLKILGRSWQFSPFIPDFPWDSLSQIYLKYSRVAIKDDKFFYGLIYRMYDVLDNDKMARIYADSLKELADFDESDEPYSNSHLGLLLSYLGECDRAVELGQRGKELLSVDECHY